MLSLYIHSPYCLVKCGYCDFHSLPTQRDDIPQSSYADAVCRQVQHIVEQYELSGRKLVSVYFGGGTPSLMETSFFERVLEAAARNFSIDANIEITAEMNPATGSLAWLREARAIGVNRLSVGVQSFQKRLLTFLDRDHAAADLPRVIDEVREAGFHNTSCDLIFGMPSQTLSELDDDLDRITALGTEHISAYQLTFEPGTPLHRRYFVQREPNLPALLDEDASLAMFRRVHQYLGESRWQRYEISNFSRSGRESRHNLHYWRHGEYLGLGSGAVSFLRERHENTNVYGRRFTTTRNVHQFIAGDFSPKDEDVIGQYTAMAEFCMLGLRTTEGIASREFRTRFHAELSEIFPKWFKQHLRGGLLVECDERLRLTDRGIEVSNALFRDLFSHIKTERV